MKTITHIRKQKTPPQHIKEKDRFKWRTMEGRVLSLDEMESKHLFYSWLMLWNHFVPKEYRIWHKHYYFFPPNYTSEMVVDSFKHLYLELKTRDDLGWRMLEVIDRVESLFKNKPEELHFSIGVDLGREGGGENEKVGVELEILYLEGGGKEIKLTQKQNSKL